MPRPGMVADQGPKDHINIRILHSGSKARPKGDTKNRGVQDPYVYVVFWGPSRDVPKLWASSTGGRRVVFKEQGLWDQELVEDIQ